MKTPDPLRLHKESLVVDGTCPLLRDKGFIDWYIEGGVDIVTPTVGAYYPAAVSLKLIGEWLGFIRERDDLVLVTTGAEARAAKAEGRTGVVFHFQGTAALEDDLRHVDAFKRLGVGIIQLTYNTEDLVGFGAQVEVDEGLKPFGREVIARCNDARIIVDCSHTGHRTSMEAIEASTQPVILSHANPRALYATQSERNVTDELICAIADSGGIMGITGFPGFLGGGARPSLDVYVDHIDHVVETAGIDHVAVAIDYYDGQHPVVDDEEAKSLYEQRVESGVWAGPDYPPPPHYYPAGIETPRTLPNLTTKLIERGYSAEDTAKILGDNWLRIYHTIWDT